MATGSSAGAAIAEANTTGGAETIRTRADVIAFLKKQGHTVFEGDVYDCGKAIALDRSLPMSVRREALMAIMPYSTDAELRELERQMRAVPGDDSAPTVHRP